MKSRRGLQARTKFHPESIRRKTQKLLEGRTVTTGDSSQNGDAANEQEEPVQAFEPEGNQVPMASPRVGPPESR